MGYVVANLFFVHFGVYKSRQYNMMHLWTVFCKHFLEVYARGGTCRYQFLTFHSCMHDGSQVTDELSEHAFKN